MLLAYWEHDQLSERIAPLFAMRDLSQCFTLLVPFAKGLNRVAKGDNGQDIDLIRNGKRER